jgi:hypothetical protein
MKMTTKDEALKLALEALNTWLEQYSDEEYEDCPEVVQTRAAIAKATQGENTWPTRF